MKKYTFGQIDGCAWGEKRWAKEFLKTGWWMLKVFRKPSSAASKGRSYSSSLSPSL